MRVGSKGIGSEDFEGRVAVVTGAASGIGLGVVDRFLTEGMKVVMADIEKVAGDIIDALRADKFWIFTHELTTKAVSARFADIEAGRNPTNPYEGIEGLGELGELSELK